jgi:hypothetical protein
MNNLPAFAPSDSLKGEPQKLLKCKLKWLVDLKHRLKVPFRGFRGGFKLAELEISYSLSGGSSPI